jgi:hypothetical protein
MYTHVTGSISTRAPRRISTVVITTPSSEPRPKVPDEVGEESASVNIVGPSGTSPRPLAAIRAISAGKKNARTATMTARIT